MIDAVKRMITSCPGCGTHFYVIPMQLAARKGFVRCGLCKQRFNALIFMTSASDFPIDSTSLTRDEKSSTSTVDSPIETVEKEDSGLPIVQSDTIAPISHNRDIIQITTSPNSELSEATLNEKLIQNSQQEIDKQLQPDELAQQEIEQLFSEQDITKSESVVPREVPFEHLFINETSNPLSSPEDIYDSKDLQKTSTTNAILVNGTTRTDFVKKNVFKLNKTNKGNGYLIWHILVVIFFILAIGQTLYYCRTVITSQIFFTKPYFEKVCKLLGCVIELPKDIQKINIDDSDLKEDAAYEGLIHVSATIVNQADVNLMYPNLELTLTDEDNKPKLRRVFKPSEYLDKKTPVNIGIPNNQETYVSLNLSAIGSAVVGYRLLPRYD